MLAAKMLHILNYLQLKQQFLKVITEDTQKRVAPSHYSVPWMTVHWNHGRGHVIRAVNMLLVVSFCAWVARCVGL